MFEGTRLSYIVPGYTGHIPKVHQSDAIPLDCNEPKYQVPGYAGYITSIKSENLFASTYGKITYGISQKDYVKGQDVPPEVRYKSMAQEQFVNQRQVLQRTAAEIVGVCPKKPEYMERRRMLEISDKNNTKGQDSQKENLQESLTKFFGDDTKEPYPLPGYTGTIKRVVAANIFGQTFANSRKTGIQDEINIQHDRVQNLRQIDEEVPKIKK